MRRKYKDNHSIIQMCMRKLRRSGFTTIGGKELHYCTYPMISTYFEKKFGYNPLKDDIENILSKNNGVSSVDEYVYVITTPDMSFCKIGYSKNPEKRLKELQTSHHSKLSIYTVFRGDRLVEKKLHQIYKSHKTMGEWFKFNGTELKTKIDSIKDSFDGLDRPFLNINHDGSITPTTYKNSKSLKLYIILDEENNECRFKITDKGFFEQDESNIIFEKEYNPNIRDGYLKFIISKYNKYLSEGTPDIYKYEGALKDDIINKNI